jgi:hypothetical protein
MWRVYIDTAWRVELEGEVLFGYADEDMYVVRSLRQLWNQEIHGAECVEGSFDLAIRFANRMVIRVFTNSKTNEQWELRCSDGFRIGIAPGLVVTESTVAPDGSGA